MDSGCILYISANVPGLLSIWFVCQMFVVERCVDLNGIDTCSAVQCTAVVVIEFDFRILEKRRKAFLVIQSIDWMVSIYFRTGRF